MSDNADFAASIENATLEIIRRAAKNMEKACLTVERTAKQNCPVDLGQLRADIHSEVLFNTEAITGIVGNSVVYATFVHNGTGIYAKDSNGRTTPWFVPLQEGGGFMTKGQQPQPYLEDAKISNAGKIAKILAGE